MAFLKTYTVDTLVNDETNTSAQICTSGRVLLDFHARCEKYAHDGVKLEFNSPEDFIAFADDIRALKDIVVANERQKKTGKLVYECNDDYCDI